VPSDASRARVMARLVPALERLLERYDSYTEISVEALMGEAGMSRRSFYAYFADKGQLMAEVADEVTAQMVVSWRPWWDRDTPAGIGDVDRALADMVEVYRPHRKLLRAVAETAASDRRVSDIYHGSLRRVADELRAYIEAGQADGLIRPQLDPATMATWLTTLLSAGLASFAGEMEDPDSRHIAAARGIAWRVLYQPRPGVP
jgi:TetR/AcrR family transcriptional regulator, ethionamide resistance regulator